MTGIKKQKGREMRVLSWTSIVILLSFFLVSSAVAQTTRIKVGYSSIGVGQSLVWVTNSSMLSS